MKKLNADPAVDGILIQLPLPRGLDARAILPAVDPRKDVDGIHPDNLGHLLMGEPRFVACTPFGIMKLIEESGLALSGDERGGGRPLEHGRQADGGAPDQRQCHRDALPLEDARARRRRRRAPTWWWPRWGARRWSAAPGSSRARW